MLHSEFDTSCFSGKYVTGEKIGDEYFTKLHDMRNDAAKLEPKNGSKATPLKTKQSNGGCESVSNDTRIKGQQDGSCEPLTNDIAVR